METRFGTPSTCPVLIGRSAELTTLCLLADRARSGTGQIVLLSGEAGIGKSRLVAEATTYATAQGFRLLQGQCFPTDRSCPYAPLLDLLRSHFAMASGDQVVAAMGSLAAVLSPLLPDLIAQPADLTPLPPLGSAQEKQRLFAALAHLILRQTATQPVLLVIEDLHWSDDTSLDFIHYLGRRCATSPVLVLLTYRSEEIQPGLSHVLAHLDRARLARECALAPLTRSDTSAMLHAIFALRRAVFMAPPLVHGDLLDAIFTLSEGNPFIIEELLTSLIEAGDIYYEHGRWTRKPLDELRIPRSVQDAVQQRTAHLSAGARQVLNLAAVAGRRFDFALLQRLTHHDEARLLRLIKELVAAQLVVEESADQFAFRHALTRQAIYARLLARERTALHRMMAETVERLHAARPEAHLADLASHYFEAGVWEKALEYGQRAGDQAQALYAPQAATLHFTRALDAARHLSHTPPAGLYRARGLAYDTLGDFERARADHETALELAHQGGEHHSAWQALIDLGLLWTGRDYAQAGPYFQQALALARAMDEPTTIAHSLNRLGNWHVNREQPREALRCHQEALATFAVLKDRPGLADTLDLLGMAEFLGGDLLNSAAHYHQAVALFRELDERRGLSSSLVSLMQVSCCNHVTETLLPAAARWAEAQQQGEQGLTIARDIGQRSGEAYALQALGKCLGYRGDYAQALEMAQRSLAIADEIGHRQWMAAGHWALGALYLDLLVLPTARQHLQQAVALAQESGSLFWMHTTTGFLARAYIVQHAVAQAASLLGPVRDPATAPHTLGQRIIWQAQAELALARDDPQCALRLTDQLLASVVGLTAEGDIPTIAKVRAEALIKLRRTAEADTILQGAQVTARQHGLRPVLWRLCLLHGKVAHGQRRYDEADRRFAAAQDILADLASNIADEAVHQQFLHHAQALFPRTRPPSPHRLMKRTFEGLTARERTVAALIAQGKSNRQIAAELVVTPRTVETHVGSILSKLGFTSRTQIAVWATEKELSNDAL